MARIPSVIQRNVITYTRIDFFRS